MFARRLARGIDGGTAWVIGLGVAIICGFAIAVAPLSAARPRPAAQAAQQGSTPNVLQPNVLQNDEIRVVIPPGWFVTDRDAPGQFLSQLGPHVQLTKNGYTLMLSYHASPKPGDAESRFTEIFGMPWLQPNQILGCSYYLRRKQKVINPNLDFIGLWFSAPDSGMNKDCGVPEGAGSRWLAGYFTDGTGGYFLRSQGTDCGQKAYILTLGAKAPSELPAPDDPTLAAVSAEAGRIVASIQYKRCPIAAGPGLGVIGVGH